MSVKHTYEIVTRLRDASRFRELAIAFEVAEEAVRLGLEGDNYITPSRCCDHWIVDVLTAGDGEVVGFIKRVKS